MTALWTAPDPLILASTSATRRGLLERAGLPVETENPRIDERQVEEASRIAAPERLAARLAAEKALAVSRRRPGRLVLGADQVLSCNGQVFHRPYDREAAFRQLRDLAGRTHSLHSAGCLARDGEPVTWFYDAAHLAMRALSEDSLNAYLDIAGEQALSGVGCYQVENLGVHLFEKIDGDHATILGLPLLPLLAALRRLGCLAF
ncbi:Maf family protein [Microvirga brassicacearum]|uniref:Nucleoside triphosphate pyrophosphatase n=1 Tax=Microvirga brassicacearum TaxID=2580413 RepID=A0A5N3PE18_9HYPH|nr:Maf family protein [Microvirga brassicacearum]KAB0267976.1 septum formation inhibitor Maf [Microvirga brassicacearum]